MVFRRSYLAQSARRVFFEGLARISASRSYGRVSGGEGVTATGLCGRRRMGCVGVRSPNYIFLFRLRQSRAITRCARKNPFADNALKRRVHGADSNYEHLYTYSFVGSYAALQHPIPTIAYISFSFSDCYYIVTTMSHLHAFRYVRPPHRPAVCNHPKTSVIAEPHCYVGNRKISNVIK